MPQATAANEAKGLAVDAQNAPSEATAPSALMPQTVMPRPKPRPAPLSRRKGATPVNAPRVNAAAATATDVKAEKGARVVKAANPQKAMKTVSAKSAPKKLYPLPMPPASRPMHPATPPQ